MKILIHTQNQELTLQGQRILLQHGYEVVPFRDGKAALRALESDPKFRIALFDEGTAGLCSKLRAHFCERYTYCIVLLTSTSPEQAQPLLEAGADDIIAPGCAVQELPGRLRTANRVLQLLEQLAAAREALRFESTHDGATGVLNRQGIGEHLRREFERATRFGKPVGLLMIDLDHFRLINESFGYSAGDRVLKEVAQRIQNAVRGYDVIGRYGADEFLVLSPEATGAAMVALAERILTSLTSIPVQFQGQDILLTASIGAAMSEDRSTTELLQAAEDAVKRAKQTGRNAIEFARDSEPQANPLPPPPPMFRIH